MAKSKYMRVADVNRLIAGDTSVYGEYNMAGRRRSKRSYGRRSYGRRRGGSSNGSMMKFALGALAGYFAPRVSPYQDCVITALAVSPVKVVPYQFYGYLKGYVGGMVLKQVMPGLSLGGLTGGSNSSTGGYV